MNSSPLKYYLGEIEKLQTTNSELQKKYENSYERYLLFKEDIGCYEPLDCRVTPLSQEVLAFKKEMATDRSKPYNLCIAETTHEQLIIQKSLIEKAISDIESAIFSLKSDTISMQNEIPHLQEECNILEQKYESLYTTYKQYTPSFLKSNFPTISPLPNRPSYQDLKLQQDALYEKRKTLESLCQSLEKAILDFQYQKQLLPVEIYDLVLKSQDLQLIYIKLYDSYILAEQNPLIPKREFPLIENDFLHKILSKETPYLVLRSTLEQWKEEVANLEAACNELSSLTNINKNHRETLICEILDIEIKNKSIEKQYYSLYNEYTKLAIELNIPEDQLISRKELPLYELDFLLDNGSSLEILEETKSRLSFRQEELNTRYKMTEDALLSLTQKISDLQKTVKNLASENIALKKASQALQYSIDETSLKIQEIGKKPRKKIRYIQEPMKSNNSFSLDDFSEIESHIQQNKGFLIKTIGFATSLFLIGLATSQRPS